MSENLYWKDKGGYFRTYVDNSFVQGNSFLTCVPESAPLPCYEEIAHQIAQPVWEGHDDAIRMYHRCWEIAFGNVKQPAEGSGFISQYIMPTFNGHIFMWDSVFMTFFGPYANRAFCFQKTLDNFYCKQHRDGFICREISEDTGEDQFHRYDPSATGPNLFAWAEMAYYRQTGDIQRLKSVFPVICGYHRWMRKFRTWQDGSYFSSGWGCGMDNQPRFKTDEPFEFFHGFLSWIDVTCQQILSAKELVQMARILHCEQDAGEFAQEADRLTRLVNETMWNDRIQFYVDKFADGTVSDVMSIGSYWALLAGIVPKERMAAFVSHLSDEKEFNRFHRVPTLSSSSSYYQQEGNYWQGGVWSPTNYMVLKGLRATGQEKLAFDIAENHFARVLSIFNETGTLYENYSPEYLRKGNISCSDFVGWTGVSAINIFIEFVLGIEVNVPQRVINWHIHQTEKHGIENLRIGPNQEITLLCEKRSNSREKPVIKSIGTDGFQVNTFID